MLFPNFNLPRMKRISAFNDEKTICCISGLNYPQTRLDIVYNKVSENKEAIKKNLAATHERSAVTRVSTDISEPSSFWRCPVRRAALLFASHFVFLFDLMKPLYSTKMIVSSHFRKIFEIF